MQSLQDAHEQSYTGAREERLLAREEAVAKREAAITVREQAALARELLLREKEESLNHKEIAFERNRNTIRALCSHCGVGRCSRKGPCFMSTGEDSHTHSCSACHAAWKAGTKGSGRQGANTRC